MSKWMNRLLAICLLISFTILPATAINEESAPKVSEPAPIAVVNDTETPEPLVPILPQITTTETTTSTNAVAMCVCSNEKTLELETRLLDYENTIDELRERLSIIEEEYVDQAEVDRQYKSLQERIDSL
ncbi:hypothetical protein LCGC14_2327370 [marine sediment metagenome]|uniref:Uncharacterized protein n=1 Tax=marine sediment metagenome TaxID=412755 RepID=A0A0F9CGP1_9ZZZZ